MPAPGEADKAQPPQRAVVRTDQPDCPQEVLPEGECCFLIIMVQPCTCYLPHPFTKVMVSPFHVAGAIRPFPPSSQDLAACRKVKVVQHTMAFRFFPRCHPPFSQA
jgi:hypothetical protein